MIDVIWFGRRKKIYVYINRCAKGYHHHHHHLVSNNEPLLLYHQIRCRSISDINLNGKKEEEIFLFIYFLQKLSSCFRFSKKNCSFLFHFLSFLLQLLFFKDWMTTSKWSIFATASSNSNKLKKLKFSFFLLYNVCQCVPNIILIDYNACWVLSFIYDVYLQNYSLPLVTSRHANDDDDKEILTLFLFFLISLSIIFCLIFIIAFACF